MESGRARKQQEAAGCPPGVGLDLHRPQEAQQRSRSGRTAEALALPFGRFVGWALEEAFEVACETGGDVAADGQCKGEDWRQLPLFHFIRLIKAHPHAEKMRAGQAFRAAAAVAGEDWGALDCDADDVEAGFHALWEKVRHLPGRDVLAEASDAAWRRPLRVAEVDRDERPAGYAHFLSLAAWLQVARSGQPVILPVERVAEVMAVRAMTVSRYLKWARQDGYLKRLRPGKRGGAAGEYAFNVALYPEVAKAAGPAAAALFRDGKDA